MQLVDATPQTTLMNYIRWFRLRSYRQYFSKDYRDAWFEYYKVLSGVDSLPPRWRTWYVSTRAKQCTVLLVF